MTTDTALLQQSLDYLKKQRDFANEFDPSGYDLIEKIEARLAQPEQEHVGYLLINKENDLCLSRIRKWVTEFGLPDNEYKLYINPQPERKPLSTDSIREIYRQFGDIGVNMIDFARAIERAHGITESAT